MGHDHSQYHAKKALDVSLIVTLVFFFVELAGGFLTNSLALLSDAAHMLTHLFALFLAWGAFKISSRQPSDRRTFGFHRVEIFSALLNGFVLVGFGLVILYTAVVRVNQPAAVQSKEMMVFAIIGLLANLYVAHRLYGFSDLNIKGAFLHVVGDTLSSLLVIGGAIWMVFTNQFIVDAILSIFIALIIIVSSFRLIWDSVHILLEGTPKNVMINNIIKEIKKVKKVKDVHAIHIWSLCSHINMMSAHVLVNEKSIANTAVIINELNQRLEKFGIRHTTFQFECARCNMCSRLREIKHV